VLAAARGGAQAVILLHGAPASEQFGITRWPALAPVQIHFMLGDRWRSNAAIGRLSRLVKASGAECSIFDCPGSAHLFAAPSLPAEYDPEATELMLRRVLNLLSKLNGRQAPLAAAAQQ